MTDKIVVLSTCGNADEADRMARALVERRLAACVNIVGGVRSVYTWKGAVEAGEELLLVIKTRRELFDAVRQALTELHSYELPECIALPIVDGSEAYLAWLESGLKQTGAGPR